MQEEANTLRVVDGIHGYLLSVFLTLVGMHIYASLLQGINHIFRCVLWYDSLLKLIKTIRAHELGFEVVNRVIILDGIHQVVISLYPIIGNFFLPVPLDVALQVARLNLCKFLHTVFTAIIPSTFTNLQIPC